MSILCWRLQNLRSRVLSVVDFMFNLTLHCNVIISVLFRSQSWRLQAIHLRKVSEKPQGEGTAACYLMDRFVVGIKNMEHFSFFFQESSSPGPCHSYFGPTLLMSSSHPTNFLPLFNPPQQQQGDEEEKKERRRIPTSNPILPFIHPIHTLFAFHNHNWAGNCLSNIYDLLFD